MSPQLAWYLARSTGIVAWALLSASVIWGLLLSTRLIRARSAPKWLLDLHRFLGGLSTIFLGLHIATIVGDSYVHFGRADVLVPFASSWKPLPVALGIVAMYCLLAVEATSLLMKKLPRRFWRRVHLASFGGFVLATAHGFTAGTDHRNLALFAAYAGVTSVVAFLTVFRVLTARIPRVSSRPDGTRPNPAGNGRTPVRQKLQEIS